MDALALLVLCLPSLLSSASGQGFQQQPQQQQPYQQAPNNNFNPNQAQPYQLPSGSSNPFAQPLDQQQQQNNPYQQSFGGPQNPYQTQQQQNPFQQQPLGNTANPYNQPPVGTTPNPYQQGSSPYQQGSSSYQQGSSPYQQGSSPYQQSLGSSPSPYNPQGSNPSQYPYRQQSQTDTLEFALDRTYPRTYDAPPSIVLKHFGTQNPPSYVAVYRVRDPSSGLPQHSFAFGHDPYSESGRRFVPRRWRYPSEERDFMQNL